jgi:NAD(P)-dependent dehydrogenase (short-subunit alcohol dehydrogenase family)
MTSEVARTGARTAPGTDRVVGSTSAVPPEGWFDASRRLPARPTQRGRSYDALVGALDLFRLDGRVAVVTGASSGLGVAFARGLAQAGADVVLAARRTDRLQETARLVEDEGRRSAVVPTDVTDPDACTALVASALDAFGRVDVLVNNAGAGTAVPATRETPEQFRSVIDVNLLGCYWMAQACGRVMRPGSAIVNISSVLGLTTAGLPQAAYASSKAGLIGLTRDLAQQWTGRKGIRVNAVAPGFFASEMTAQYPEGYLEGMLHRVPAGRGGHLEELAATVVFLSSDAAGYITGQTLAVDGGMTIT